MGEWREYKLSEIIHIIGGGTPSRSKPEFWGGTIPWLSVKDFNASRRYVENTEEHITQLGLSKSSTKILTNGQIIISARGTVGELAQVVGEMAFNQSCYGLDAKPEYLTNDYLYYLMKYTVSNLKKLTHGAVFDTITKNTFDYANVKIPESKQQAEVVKILGSLDDKIELNRKMNETLEEMARAIFKSWFVDFDPVHAKARGDKPERLPDEIADLFPSEFVHSDQLNKSIPKGWEVKPLGDIFNLTMGQSPPGNTYNEEAEGVPFYQGKTDFGFRFPTRRIYCNAPKRMAEQFDILVSVRAPVGDVNVANEECCIGRGLAALKHKSGSFSYSYYAMKNLESIFKSYESGGTVFGSINQKEFKALKLLEPIPELISKFESYVSSMDEKILNNSKQINTLQEQRDSLLPKLISGEIEV